MSESAHFLTASPTEYVAALLGFYLSDRENWYLNVVLITFAMSEDEVFICTIAYYKCFLPLYFLSIFHVYKTIDVCIIIS